MDNSVLTGQLAGKDFLNLKSPTAVTNFLKRVLKLLKSELNLQSIGQSSQGMIQI